MALVTPVEQYSLPNGHGLADMWWKTGRVIVKATASETGGSFSQVETIDPCGTATPLHLHRNEEESFYVLEGEVSLLVDGKWTDISEGDYAFVPRNLPHAYVVRSERARMLVTFSPSGFDEVFVDLGVPVTEHAGPPAETVLPPVEEIVRAFAPYGCEILGPPPAL